MALMACGLTAIGQASATEPPQSAAATKPGPAWEQVSIADLRQRWPTLPFELRVAAIEQLIANGAFDDADALLTNLNPPPGAGPEIDARFLRGALRKAQGQLPEAIAIFRELLAAHPKLTRARFELAHALFLQQEDEAAQHHFDLVRGALNNPDLDRVVQSFVDQMAQRRRWTASAYFSIAPSTNLNQGADTRTVSFNGLDFSLDEHTHRKSGVGVVAGFNAGYRYPLTDRLDMVVGGGANARQYEEDVFNDYVATGEVGPRYRFDWGDVGLYATASRRWFSRDAYQLGKTAPSGHTIGADPYALFMGGRLAISTRFSPQDVSNSSFACLQKRYDVFVWQDGWNCSEQLSIDHFIDSSTFVRLLGGFEMERTHTDNQNYMAGNVGVGVYHEFGWGVTLYGQMTYTRRAFDGIYPTTTYARNDNRYDASLMITKRDWQIFGLAPSLQYTYSLQDSNVDFTNFDAHGVSITLTKKF